MTIHLVSFDIPYPPIYGGIIDIYNKIISFKKHGVKVHLHCFQYNDKKESNILNSLCDQVDYYPRKSFFKSFYKSVPYIIDSRQSEELLSKLIEDDYPILFEGLHTCFYLNHPSLKNHRKVVWMHNIESDYYHHLGEAEKNIFSKIYFSTESKKLKEYESILSYADAIVGVSRNDAAYYQEKYKKGHYIPAFHRNSDVLSKEGRGTYLLYHGSLDVVENHQAAMWLIEKVASKLDIPFIIAGKNPKSSLKDSIKKYPHISLKENTSFEEMDQLIADAHIHLLPTFQDTGIKHKLLNALYNGRFVVANDKMVANTGLESLCIVHNTSEEIIHAIQLLMDRPFDSTQIERRKSILMDEFNNDINIFKLIALLK